MESNRHEDIRLSVIVPCYNEAKNIPLILDRFSGILERDDIEVILVDNGSSDESQEVLEQSLPEYPFARSIRVEVNQGYGFGILCGLNAAKGEFLAWTHADMQTDPHDVIKALQIIEQSADPLKTFVKGNRQGRSPAERFFTAGMSFFETIYLGVCLNDVNAQPNLFHRSFFRDWIDPPNDFALDLYALYMARRQGYNLIRLPVLFSKRLHGHSHWNSGFRSRLKFIKRTLEYSFRLKKRLD